MTFARRRAGRNVASGSDSAKIRIARSRTPASSATLGRPTTMTTPAPLAPMSERAVANSASVICEPCGAAPSLVASASATRWASPGRTGIETVASGASAFWPKAN